MGYEEKKQDMLAIRHCPITWQKHTGSLYIVVILYHNSQSFIQSHI